MKTLSKYDYLQEEFRDKEKAKQYLLSAFETDDNEILACALKDVFQAYSDDIKNYRYTINELTEQNAALLRQRQEDAIPQVMLDQALKVGRVEWGRIPAKSDQEHVKEFAESLALTRAQFNTVGDQPFEGVFLEGSETVLCQTGTSPNSPVNAQTIVSLWNWLVDKAETLPKPPHKEG